jgi:hypothetical protein
LDQYGYAAFSLSVIPYALMSIVNSVGNVITPDYSCLFIVHSDVLKEAANWTGGKFVGAVGYVTAAPTPSGDRGHDSVSFEACIDGTLRFRDKVTFNYVPGYSETWIEVPAYGPLGRVRRTKFDHGGQVDDSDLVSMIVVMDETLKPHGRILFPLLTGTDPKRSRNMRGGGALL